MKFVKLLFLQCLFVTTFGLNALMVRADNGNGYCPEGEIPTMTMSNGGQGGCIPDPEKKPQTRDAGVPETRDADVPDEARDADDGDTFHDAACCEEGERRERHNQCVEKANQNYSRCANNDVQSCASTGIGQCVTNVMTPTPQSKVGCVTSLVVGCVAGAVTNEAKCIYDYARERSQCE